MLCAAIDIGTVTSRLLIADCYSAETATLEQLRHVGAPLEYRISFTNLGEGLTASGLISGAARTRLLGTLREFGEAIEEVRARYAHAEGLQEAIPVKAVATSAMRDAANAAEVLAELSAEGFAVEVISGTREAELSFKGTLSGFDFTQPGSAVMSIDVGGGSTELIIGTAGLPETTHILTSRSFDLGSRRITELYLPGDSPSASQLLNARAWVKELIQPYCAALPVQPSEIIAVAGTATTALTIRDRITVYDRTLVHGKRLTMTELEALISQLSALSLEERKQVPGLHPARASVIVGGLVILATLLDVLGRESLLISDTDILQGIILESATIC